MLVLITYDVKAETAAGRRRLSKIAKVCCNYGQRVQNSVFECDVDASQYIVLKNSLIKLMNEAEDSIRFYNLGKNYMHRIEQFGTKHSYDPEGVLMV